jgi:hydroxyacylglutathione hydrolase
MPQKIHTIPLSFPFNMGSVNCYLVQTDSGFFLIDTGPGNRRAALEEALQDAGCQPGDLKLILITHGDFDHIGNAAALRRKYATKIAMHPADAGMAEQGDMFYNREQSNFLVRKLAPLFSGFGKDKRFAPDISLEDGDDLSQYGFEAQALHLPGHSSGSIGILTADGALFCGDLFGNTGQPEFSSLMDDMSTAIASFEKVARLDIGTVYPGHGQPFPMVQLVSSLHDQNK